MTGVDWSVHIFAYCERGTDPSFWAEPFNALTNAAFLLAAWFGWQRYRVLGVRDGAVAALIAMVAIIGVGSFLFHTLATRAAVVADVVPIAVFTLSYLVFALRRLAEARWVSVIALVGLFLACVAGSQMLPCPTGLLPATAAFGRPCFNGSLMYVPAWISLVSFAVYMARLDHPATGYLAKAAVLNGLALVFRTIDIEVCGASELAGAMRGTHGLWHVLNALALYALLRAALLSSEARQIVLRARPESAIRRP